MTHGGTSDSKRCATAGCWSLGWFARRDGLCPTCGRKKDAKEDAEQRRIERIESENGRLKKQVALLKTQKGTCRWTLKQDDVFAGRYETTCGDVYLIPEDRPELHEDFIGCPYCMKRIEVVG